MKNGLLKLVLFSGMISLGGCSSVMSHTGGKEGTYPGTRASAQMLGDSDANWGTKSLVALDIARGKERERDAGDQLRDPASANAEPLI